MATGIRELKNGYQITFRYQGKRYFEPVALKPCPANLARVVVFRQEIIDSIKAGTFDYHFTFPNSKNAEQFAPPVLTIEKYLKEWLEEKRKIIAASTYKGYMKVIHGHLIPEFGDIELNKITKADIRSWVKRTDITHKTRVNILSPLRTALREAVDDEVIKANPLADFRLRKPKNEEKRIDPIDPFTMDEMNLILSVLDGQSKNLVQFMLWSGLRTSEVCGLDWSSIDFQRGKIGVVQAYTQAATKMEDTKTSASYRWITMLDPARDALLAQKTHTYLKGKEVFQNPRTGNRWEGDAPIRKTMWVHALKRANVRYRYPYQLRHTFATMMLNCGENIRWISEHLGHTNWTFTARTYTRFMPSEFKGAGLNAVKLFWQDSGSTPK